MRGNSWGWSSGLIKVFRRQGAWVRNQLAVGCLFSLCFPWQPLSIALLMPSAFAFCLFFFVVVGFFVMWFLWGFFNQDTCSLKIDSHWIQNFFMEMEQVSSHTVVTYSVPRGLYLLFPRSSSIVWAGAMVLWPADWTLWGAGRGGDLGGINFNLVGHHDLKQLLVLLVSIDLWAKLGITWFHFHLYDVFYVSPQSTLEQNLNGKTALPWKCSSSSLSTWTAPSFTLPFFLAGKLSLLTALKGKLAQNS